MGFIGVLFWFCCGFIVDLAFVIGSLVVYCFVFLGIFRFALVFYSCNIGSSFLVGTGTSTLAIWLLFCYYYGVILALLVVSRVLAVFLDCWG